MNISFGHGQTTTDSSLGVSLCSLGSDIGPAGIMSLVDRGEGRSHGEVEIGEMTADACGDGEHCPQIRDGLEVQVWHSAGLVVTSESGSN